MLAYEMFRSALIVSKARSKKPEIKPHCIAERNGGICVEFISMINSDKIKSAFSP